MELEAGRAALPRPAPWPELPAPRQMGQALPTLGLLWNVGAGSKLGLPGSVWGRGSGMRVP